MQSEGRKKTHFQISKNSKKYISHVSFLRKQQKEKCHQNQEVKKTWDPGNRGSNIKEKRTPRIIVIIYFIITLGERRKVKPVCTRGGGLQGGKFQIEGYTHLSMKNY